VSEGLTKSSQNRQVREPYKTLRSDRCCSSTFFPRCCAMKHYFCVVCHAPLRMYRGDQSPRPIPCRKKRCKESIPRGFRADYWEDDNIDLFEFDDDGIPTRAFSPRSE